MRAIGLIGLITATAWFAVDAALAGVAMSTFGTLKASLGDLPGRTAAGQVFGDILAWWMIVAWVLFALTAIALCVGLGQGWERGRRAGPIAAGVLVLALAAVHGYGHHLVGSVADAREGLAENADPRDDEDFQVLHKRSERVFAAEGLLALVAVLALVPMTASRPPRERDHGAP